MRPPQDAAQPMKGVPPRTIRVDIRDGNEQPLANTEVKLGILRASVAEGESRSTRKARTDENGTVTFDNLQASSRFSYRVHVDRGDASFASAPFPLDEKHGHRVLLHVYDVTRSLENMQLGLRGLVFIDTRDDIFQVEMVFAVFNLSRRAWVPSDVSFRLPEKFKAFKANDSMTDARFEADEAGVVRMHGTFTPGTHQASFRFQLPNSRRESTQELSFELPPRVAQMQVIAAAHQNMQLSVDKFPPAKKTKLRNGQDGLASALSLRPGDPPLNQVSLELSGIPTRSKGAYYATAIALAIALLGGVALTQNTSAGGQRKLSGADAEQAKQVLLHELTELEKAYREQRIGPRTYAQAKGALLSALSRVLAS